MDVLAWLVVPLAVTALGVAWATWRSRPARTPGDAETARDYSRFRAALERPHPARGRSVVHQPLVRSHAVGVRHRSGKAQVAGRSPGGGSRRVR